MERFLSGSISPLFLVVGSLVLLGQFVFQWGFLRLDAEQKRLVLGSFQPRGKLLAIVIGIVAIGVVGLLLTKQLWFAGAFMALVAGTYATISWRNIVTARRLQLPSRFVRGLWIAGALRMTALLAVATLLAFAVR